MIHALKLAAYIKLSFFDQNVLGLKLAFTPTPSTSRYRDPLGRVIGPAVGLFTFYMNFENSSYHRLCKSNVAVAVCYIQVKFVYSGSMLAV